LFTRINKCRLTDAAQILQLANIGRRRTFGTFDYIKADPRTLGQGFKTLTLNCGMMYENIIAAVFGDEAKTLCIIKPFNCSFYHFYYSFCVGFLRGTIHNIAELIGHLPGRAWPRLLVSQELFSTGK